MKRISAGIDVVEAAERRIRNVFSNGLPVYMSFSGGKDSLVLGQLTMSMIQRGQIRPELLTVQFVDEEAIFPCIEKTVLDWRRKFILAGADFEWLCVEVKHFNCFNDLSEEETFICWDSTKEDVWIRRPPAFATRRHHLLRPRKDSYQDFMPRLCMDGIAITGVRAAESVQRLQYMARLNMGMGGGMTGRGQVYPIYDWRTSDVWRYLRDQRVEIPEIYLYLWQSGTTKGQLRVSQFFSTDTARSLVRLNEYYPDLMDRIIRREPNAYLAALYWDSEMFGRRTRTRRELEASEDPRDYQAMLIQMFSNMEQHFTTPRKLIVAKRYRHLFMKISPFATAKDYREMYDALMRGDPKLRTYRALYQTIYGRYAKDAVMEQEAVKRRA
ncbi:MAG: phosphoadenosine phosphosulfate reductase family protein [Oscillospiraceae bacterium]|jgi:predicted phosphoadenosine phosphosulfate sulfurtransferase|nr:phosphoadenosine phosphosulfate reductase family protein [Oscillospiraceae bacterium]